METQIHPSSGISENNNESNAYHPDLDENHDGRISNQELNSFVMKVQLKDLESNLLKRVLKILILLLGIFSIAIILLIFGLLEVTKEMKTNDGKMTDPQTGETLGCASTDFVVTSEGVLTSTASVQRRLSASDSIQLSPEIVNALGVRNFYQQTKLHSSLPEKYFREMLWLNLESPTAATLSLKVLSVIRIPHNKAKCGSFLKLTTINGVLLLDDETLMYDHDIYQLFSQTGLLESTLGTSSQRRILHHLSSSHHTAETRGFRRLNDDKSLGLVGFFNSIEDYEWTCESVEKPEMPNFYSADLLYYTACLNSNDDKSPNRCAIEVDPIGELIVPGVEFRGSDAAYHRTLKKSFVTSEATYLVSFPPHHPGTRVVSEYYPSQRYFRTYQVSSEGKLSHCEHNELFSVKMNLPDDFIFYPVGTEDNMRRFKISFESEDQKSYLTMEYYDDVLTHLPKMLIFPNSDIITIDSIKIGSDMDSFFDLGINVSSSQFLQCHYQYKAILSKMNNPNQLNETNSSFNFEANSSLIYPPDSSLPATAINIETIFYYASKFIPNNFQDSNLKDLISEIIVAWIKWYQEVFTPSLEDGQRRRMMETVKSAYQTSFMEYYMSMIEGPERELLSNRLLLAGEEDQFQRNITILKSFFQDSPVIQQSSDEYLSRYLQTGCVSKRNGPIQFCVSSLRIMVRVEYRAGSLSIGLLFEASRLTKTESFKIYLSGYVGGCYLGVLCAEGSITTNTQKNPYTIAGCLSFSLDLTQIPILRFLGDLNMKILQLCYTYLSSFPSYFYDLVWWPGNLVKHGPTHILNAAFYSQILYAKFQATANVALFTTNGMCTTGRVYNGQTVTQSCIWDSYYDGGGRASMDVTIFYYDSVFPFCGDWVQLWSVRLLDYNWYGF